MKRNKNRITLWFGPCFCNHILTSLTILIKFYETIPDNHSSCKWKKFTTEYNIHYFHVNEIKEATATNFSGIKNEQKLMLNERGVRHFIHFSFLRFAILSFSSSISQSRAFIALTRIILNS